MGWLLGPRPERTRHCLLPPQEALPLELLQLKTAEPRDAMGKKLKVRKKEGQIEVSHPIAPLLNILHVSLHPISLLYAPGDRPIQTASWVPLPSGFGLGSTTRSCLEETDGQEEREVGVFIPQLPPDQVWFGRGCMLPWHSCVQAGISQGQPRLRANPVFC